MAANAGQIEIAKFLLQRGADIDAHWYLNDMTPLLLALHSNHPEVARLLIDKGAEVNVRDKMRHTPLKYATEEKNQELIKLLRDHGAKD